MSLWPLDHARKQEILPYLEALKLRVQSPVFYVSHSMEEVSRLADYVVVLQEGKVLSQGPVTEVFSSWTFQGALMKIPASL